jgi:ribosomal protein S18 acetylase RimI-like enzyme
MYTYKKLIFNEEEILKLYLDNEWFLYTNNKDLLFEGIKNSLEVYACYDMNRLVGLIRVVGDKATIIYIQDILVMKTYQRKGIGTNLIKYILNKYANVRQIVLLTDNQEKNKLFYQSLGFVETQIQNCQAYIYGK